MNKNNKDKNKRTTELPDANLAFFPVPKVASSSIKRLMYHGREGKPFVDKDEQGKRLTIHKTFFPTGAF